jgi:hypothetical protein
MRSRTRLVALILAGVFLMAAAASSGDGPARRQWAAVYLSEPTMIGATIVQGPVVFVHDDGKMARGEPCTSVLLFEPGKGPTEEIAAFHCIPQKRGIAHRFTLTTRPNVEFGLGCVLIEYQFAGDAEGHGVPFATNADE